MKQQVCSSLIFVGIVAIALFSVATTTGAIAPPATTRRNAPPQPAPSDIPQLGTYLPPVMDQKEIDVASELLMLSQAQQAHVEELVRVYRAEQESIRKQHGTELESLRQAASVAVHPQVSSSSVAAYDALLTFEERVARELNQADHRLFAGIELLLAEAQSARAPLMHARRDRTRARFIDHYATMGAATIDLIDALRRQGVHWEDYEQLPAAVESYIVAISGVSKSLDERYERQRLPSFKLDVVVVENVSTNPAAAQAAKDEQRAMRESKAREQRRLADLNLEYARRIATLLPEPIDDRFMADVRRRSFHHLYPDPTIPTRILSTILGPDGLAPEQREAASLIIEQNRNLYDATTRRMETASLDRAEEMARSFSGQDYPAYRDQMRHMRDTRLAINRDLVDRLLGILPASSIESLQPMIDSWRSEVDNVTATWATDRFPPK